MKTHKLLPLLLALSLTSSISCTRSAAQRRNLMTVQDERVRENVSAAAAANKAGQKALAEVPPSAPVQRARNAYDLSLDFLTRSQTITGLPAEDQTKRIESLLSDNASLRTRAEIAERARIAEEQKWVIRERELVAKLVTYGEAYEKERNQSVVKRTWAWILGTFGVGGTIALFVLFPALLPVVGQLIGWLVSVMPSIASFLGVVPVKAFQAVVKGIEKTKAAFTETGTPYATTVMETALSRSMDKAHKDLVKEQKKRVMPADL